MRRDRWCSTFALFGGVVLAGCGSAGASARPVATAKGTLDGGAVSATVGVAGGSLSSADGRLALSFPVGALAGDTVVSIQPITNLAHGGIGAAYRLSPEGQTFAQPVALTFTYLDAELAGTAAELLGAASQTADGYWEWTKGPVLDAGAKTVSVQAAHFSDWSMVKGWQLRPPEAKVKVDGVVALKVASCYMPPGDPSTTFVLGYECDHSADEVAPLLPVIRAWRVNNVEKGNSTIGVIEAGRDGTGTYIAPSSRPSPSVVAVTAETSSRTWAKILLVSNITVEGAPPRVLEVSHEGTERVGETNDVRWNGGHDGFSLTVRDDGWSRDYGKGGTDGELPAWMKLQNATTNPNSATMTAPCMGTMPPQLLSPFELVTVQRVKYAFDPDVVFRFDGVRHIPGVSVADAPCLSYVQSYPAADLAVSIQFPVGADAWARSASEPVTVMSRDGHWSLTLSASSEAP